MSETEGAAISSVKELARRWASAERAGDRAELAALATSDFMLVGPAGFVLDKPAWLDRFADDALRLNVLHWRDTSVRLYGDAAVVVGIREQRGTYRGAPADGTYRATQVAIYRGDAWLLVSVHLSALLGPEERVLR